MSPKSVIIALILSLGLIVGAAVLVSRTETPPVDRKSQGIAALSIDRKSADLGNMKSDEERSADFIIKNTSDQTLRLWSVATSCDCTFAKITIGSEEVGEFNMPMHMTGRLKNWLGEVPAGQDAKLTVIYRPKVMPVQGEVTRQVNLNTNDPKNPNIEVSIRAFVK